MSEAVQAASRRRWAWNPVLEREINERMRSVRTTVVLVAYLALLAVILYLAYRFGVLGLQPAITEGGASGQLAAASLGRLMFEVLLLFLLGLIAFIAPGASSGAIAGERERGTLQLLQVTLLKPRSIILGKLAASLGFLILLLLASMPLFTVPLILGGVTPGQAARGFAVAGAMTVFLVCVGLFLSTIARRSMLATLGAYAVTFLLLAGTLVTYGMERIARSSGYLDFTERPVSTYLNPFAATADAVVDLQAPGFLPSPFSIVRNLIPSFLPGGMTGSADTIADGEAEGVEWRLTWRETPEMGACVGLQTNNSGGEGCGMLPADDTLTLQTYLDPPTQFIYGPAGKKVEKVRIELAEGDPIEAKPIKVPRRHRERNFFVVALAPEQQPIQAVGLSAKGEELGTQPFAPMFPPKFGIEPFPVPPDVPPRPMPLPAEARAGSSGEAPPEAQASPSLEAVASPFPKAVAPPSPVAEASPLPVVQAPASEAPASDLPVQVMRDPPPMNVRAVPAPGIMPFPQRPVAAESNVWEIHVALLLLGSVALVVLSTLRLQRPDFLRIRRRAES